MPFVLKQARGSTNDPKFNRINITLIPFLRPSLAKLRSPLCALKIYERHKVVIASKENPGLRHQNARMHPLCGSLNFKN